MTKNHITIGLDMNDGSHINLKNTNLFFAERNLWFGAGFYIGYWCHFYRYVGEIISNVILRKHSNPMISTSLFSINFFNDEKHASVCGSGICACCCFCLLIIYNQRLK